MTTAEAVAVGIPRWMVLAMPDDVAQVVALADLYPPCHRREIRDWMLRELRRTQWERAPRKHYPKPRCLRPSKRTSGYRTNSIAHKITRLRMEPQRRAEIARKGALARWNAENSSAA